MVFSSSVPVFLDPPNWPQQQNHHHGQANNGTHITGHEIFHQHHHQLPPLPPNPNTNHQASAGTPGGLSARSGGGSMSDRARLAKLPQPEGSLKCPRCESTNTKFCYFNNYSLSQPRHFCKTCRRYWTRGGALRSVPVGGGCRRNNKKGKNGKQKSNGQVNKQTTTSGVIMSESMGNDQINQTNPNFPFLASLQNLSQFGNIGLNLGGISSNENLNPSAAVNQFAFFDPTNIGLYQFHGDGNGNIASASATGRVSQIAPVKMEENRLLNLSSRPISGFTSAENNNNPFWVGAPDFSGLNNSLANNQVL